VIEKMIKTLIAAIATAGIFFISLIQMCHAMPEPTISVEPSYLNVSQGDTFTINITINPDAVEIGSVQYALYFNNALLTVIEQTQGPFLSQDGASTSMIKNEISNTDGKIEYAEYRVGDPDVIGGITTPGVLATITFKAMEEQGTSSLDLSNVIISNPYGVPYSKITNNGTCDIGTTPTPTLTPSPTPISTPTPTPTPTLTPTPTPTPAPTQTPTSESGNSGNGGTSVMPTPTSATPLSSGEDNSNEGAPIMPTQTPGSTPTQTPTINSVQSPLPSSSPTTTTPPTPTTSMRGENNRLPGFGAAFAITGLFAISYFILKRKRGGDG